MVVPRSGVFAIDWHARTFPSFLDFFEQFRIFSSLIDFFEYLMSVLDFLGLFNHFMPSMGIFEIEWGWASHRGPLPCPTGDGSHRKCTPPETHPTGDGLHRVVGPTVGTGGTPTGTAKQGHRWESHRECGTHGGYRWKSHQARDPGGAPTRRVQPRWGSHRVRNPGGAPTGCARPRWDSHQVRTAPVGCPPGAAARTAPVGLPSGP
ncbi:hypothetical protein Taro_035687 [Colocasia esculenta]|uniref:Uncharacterized protein n=1 Tax=Colocasia esculenta TaxID=4460 RepID=A0A843W6E4_COLES|nr:hypothetical protein [Colocasia esculenta]